MFFDRFSKPTVPIIHQSEAADCGIACLAMILGSFGYATKPAEIKRSIANNLKRGLTIQDLVEIAQGYQLLARSVKVSAEDLCGEARAIILHWDFEHFVVYVESNKKHVVIHDPGVGRRQLTWTEFRQSFTGIAIVFDKAKDFTSRKASPEFSYRQIVALGMNSKQLMGKLLLHTLGFQVFFLIFPFLLRSTIDNALVSNNAELLPVLFGLLLVAGIFETAFTYLKSQAAMTAKVWLEYELGKYFVEKLYRLCPTYFEGRFIGEIVSRSQSIREISNILSDELPKLILNALCIVLNFFLILYYSPVVALMSAVLVIPIFYVSMAYGRARKYALNEYVTVSSKERNTFIESVQQIGAIKLSGYESQKFTQWINEFSLGLNKLSQSLDLEKNFSAIESISFTFIRVLAVYVLLRNALAGQLSLGEFFSAYLFVAMFIEGFRAFVRSFSRMESEKVHLQRVDDILSEPDRLPVIEHPGERPDLSGQIRVQGISFRYGSKEPWLFQDLSFDINPGETVVVTGKSGIGKSSLLKCLLGVYDTMNGSISYDGIDLQEIGLETVTRNSSVYLQNQKVFSASIVENITMYESDFDHSRVEEVLRAVCLYETVMRMPMKLDTNALFTLSGGQAQRVLIARALYKNPKMIFFDEATNQLDRQTEISIVNYLKSQTNTTKIMIAHRQETIDLADKVIDLNDFQQAKVK